MFSKSFFLFSGKKFLRTGGSKGIGLEVCKILLEKNAIVHSISRTKSKFNHVNFFQHCIDLSKITESDSLLAKITQIEFDVLINNIGSTPGLKSFSEMNLCEIEKHLFLNVKVHLIFLKIFSYKKVVFTNSILGFSGVKNNSIYCASKAFITILNESLRRENVDTYIIHPAKVNTGLFSFMGDFLVLDKKVVAQTIVDDIAFSKKSRIIPFYFEFYQFRFSS